MEKVREDHLPILVRNLVDLKRIVPVASATPFVDDGVGVVGPHLSG